MLEALQQGAYVDEATRLVTAEVTVYNPMLDMWVLFVFMIESPKAGGMIPSRTFQTVRLYTVMESQDMGPFILEVRCARCTRPSLLTDPPEFADRPPPLLAPT